MDLTDDQKREIVAAADSELVHIYKALASHEVNALLIEALTAYPGDNQRADYYSQGFRHGKVVGMNYLLDKINELLEEAKDLQQKK